MHFENLCAVYKLHSAFYEFISLVPRLSAQLFFAYFTTCEKKLGREPGNEAMNS